VLHLQETIGAALDVLANLVPMSRAVQECAKDEHVQRTLYQPCCFVRHCGDFHLL